VELQGNQDAINRAQQSKVLLENTLRFSESALAAESRALSQHAPETADSKVVGEATTAVARRSDALRAELSASRLRYLDEHPEVKRLKAELNRALAEESAAAAQRDALQFASSSATQPRPVPMEESASIQARAELIRERERVSNTKVQLELLHKDIATREADRQRILREIRKYQSLVEKLPIREQQLTGLTRDYEISKANYQSLLDKSISAMMASDMERSQQSERFTIADPARVPTKPIKPNRLLYCGLATLASLIFSVVLAWALELRQDLFLGEWELPPTVIVMGRIPRINSASPAVRCSSILACLLISSGFLALAQCFARRV
jgi:uncharacterized protein involved in exopolysaccharide biosynthesis